MPQEIERKFLVKSDFKPYSESSIRIKQGYLSSVPERIVRIRIAGDNAFITVKGITNDSGMSRFEWEKKISVDEAQDLLRLCEPGIIDKYRYLVKAGDFTFEVDEFYGENLGLVIAEIELSSEDDLFEKPDWLGEEVTGNKNYYNSRLARKPFIQW